MDPGPFFCTRLAATSRAGDEGEKSSQTRTAGEFPIVMPIAESALTGRSGFPSATSHREARRMEGGISPRSQTDEQHPDTSFSSSALGSLTLEQKKPNA